DVDTSQVEFEPKDDEDSNEATANDCDTEAITKEEEWITKRKTELTTTRQIETRVQRQVKLQAGKVIEDSGPIVSTNTTEDTDKQETETTEKRDLGLPDDLDGNAQLIDVAALEEGVVDEKQLAQLQQNFGVVAGMGTGTGMGAGAGAGGKLVKRMVARPSDGLVRQVDDKRVISHEEIKDYHETQDVKHMGDITDETYVKAVREGAEDLEAVLCSPQSQQQLVALGPQLIAETSRSRKTIDSEETQKRCLAQEDGTLVTESKRTTEHEIILDGDEPADSKGRGQGHELLLGGEQLKTTAASQRYFKQRDEQHVDLLAGGKVVASEMRYAAETMQMDKDGSLERPGDWDSLSDRMRKLRRSQQQQQQKEVALLADRKDALTKRPLDFDREEETRKGETMKWLESHFGSESTASNDSRDDENNDAAAAGAADVEPTKKSYFNVTIKSQSQLQLQQQQQQQQQQPPVLSNGNLGNAGQTHLHTQTLPRERDRDRDRDRERLREQERDRERERSTLDRKHVASSGGKFYQGISNWAERQELPQQQQQQQHFSSQAFREDLQETIRRKQMGGVGGALPLATPTPLLHGDSYVSREDILQQKRQSLSAQFLARNARGSRDALNELDALPAPASASVVQQQRATSMQRAEARGKSYERSLESHHHHAHEYSVGGGAVAGRPTVPQRRRAIEKKLSEQKLTAGAAVPPAPPPPPLAATLELELEPPPDYSPPPRSRSRSRSSSPQVDYLLSRPRHGPPHGHAPLAVEPSSMTLNRKQQQRTRFAPAASASASNSNLSTLSSSKPSRMGQVIGNSLRKLVSKIRTASAERKFRMKSRAVSKSREQSPAAQNATPTTYQQYNVIDGHINGNGHGNGHANGVRHSSQSNDGSDGSNSDGQRRRKAAQLTALPAAQSQSQSQSQLISPRQRYYLGEDPYSSTLYGKENMYERHATRATRPQQQQQQQQQQQHQRFEAEEEVDYYDTRGMVMGVPPPTSTHTLGRYQKHSQRFSGSTPNLHAQQDYRSAQTLPRKLHEQPPRRYAPLEKPQPPLQSQSQSQQQRQLYVSPAAAATGAGAGPAKPARTYAKVLNRSKSFNVHGMNGSNDPSPIYIEKLTRNNYNYNNYSNAQAQAQAPVQVKDNGHGMGMGMGMGMSNASAYKSNPHLYSAGKDNSLKSGLKSPSIVNLISRSQRDLTKLDGQADEQLYAAEDKKQLYLRGLHQQAPELYRVMHGDEDAAYGRLGGGKYALQPKYSLDSRAPPAVELNKDTASIVRRGSEVHATSNLQHHHHHHQQQQQQQHQHLRRGSGATIIELRNRK
ncbi:chas, partial [Drosophila busckii]